ncbi:integrin beta-PS [Bicyclus anynana]|uniref:Integrin beta n=1 Tax=Bicyclus anynana TaxID=110368 RepID=A0ABM3M6Q3_BICAN|nr:integrin beta-PS [Bicyclus anynana]
MNLLSLFFILYLKVSVISCQSQCKDLQTCSECISFVNDTCVWCSAREHTGRRCYSKISLEPSWCKEPVYDPKEIVETTSQKDFNDGKDKKQIVQFKPQHINIKSRINVPITFNMSYKPAQDYPLDVYYLIDSSQTMNTYKQSLRDQGLRIFKELNKITNNVRLGVGGFIEKLSLPFADPSTQGPYTFKNIQGLTNNANSFIQALDILLNSNGSNIDSPEADLDALMQAMVCKDIIGWRKNSHRIILISTDSTYHRAGDGKFVGAIRPNNMQCNLNDKNYLIYDYPSLSQINKIATENNIMIIFAVNNESINDYEALGRKIKNAKCVPIQLEGVVDMIIKEYWRLFSSVQIDATVNPSLRLKFKPDCTVKDSCNYKNKEPVNITVTLVIESCSEINNKHEVKIGPVTIDEKLTVHVEADCQCHCEKPGAGEKDSDACSKAGTYQCGMCYCNENRYGDTCKCTGKTQDLEKCKASSNDPKPCSDRGICSCGKCNCPSGFSGDFCQFDDDSCVRPGGILCAGNGKCEYGKCQCDQGWLPDDCLCPSNNNSCIAPQSNEFCSGRGDCNCGQCKCNTADTGFCTGTYCEKCVESKANRCPELEDYAYCNLNMNKTTCDDKFNLTNTDVIIVNKTTMYSDRWYLAKMWCTKVLDNERILVFRYHYPKTASNSTLLLIIQDELEDQPVADVWVVVASVIGAVLLIGILTLIAWKLLVDMHDKREYEKFIMSSTEPGYDESSNPLYNAPATRFVNPAYAGEDCH